MSSKSFSLFSILFLVFQILHAQSPVDQDLVNEFIINFAKMNERPEEEIKEILNQATFQQSIIDKMNRPAEAMPWYRYRKIFMSDERAQAGAEFWQEHEATLNEIYEKTGVDPHVIVGIIGVETYYGRIKGDYRVLDALYTLAFAYPKRSRYFRSELEHFILMAEEEGLEITEVKGSYAGAMGYCQFMPSSYRAYARSFEPGGTRDLMSSPEDAIASVANYLEEHRWKSGAPVATIAEEKPQNPALPKQPTRPKQTYSYYQNMGFGTSEAIGSEKVTLLEFDQENDNKEYWFGFDNFYVITRYNHSPLYALVVHQLSEEVLKRR